MVQDGAPNGKLLLSAASALLLERRRGESQHAVFKAGAFYPPDVILQDLSVKIARGGFKWCSPVLSTGSVPPHQAVWKYPLPLSALLGERWVCDGRSWSLAGTASAAALPRKHQCSPI